MPNDTCLALIIFILDCECIIWVEVNVKSIVTQFIHAHQCNNLKSYITLLIRRFNQSGSAKSAQSAANTNDNKLTNEA